MILKGKTEGFRPFHEKRTMGILCFYACKLQNANKTKSIHNK